MPDIKPIPGPEIFTVQQHMVTPAEVEEPGEQEEDARQGGRIETAAHSEEETRPQELHSAVKYQEKTADPGKKPRFVGYTELSKTKGEVKG